jgi:magnesium-transporting ATPase (P-type)
VLYKYGKYIMKTGYTGLSLPLLDIKSITDLHAVPIPEIYKRLGARPEGLTESEVKERQNQFGRNSILKVKGKPLVLKLLANFTHLMALLLWIGGVVGFIAKMPQRGSTPTAPSLRSRAT